MSLGDPLYMLKNDGFWGEFDEQPGTGEYNQEDSDEKVVYLSDDREKIEIKGVHEVSDSKRNSD
jgi:hypothetical protein